MLGDSSTLSISNHGSASDAAWLLSEVCAWRNDGIEDECEGEDEDPFFAKATKGKLRTTDANHAPRTTNEG
jgi:hypothetical protein